MKVKDIMTTKALRSCSSDANLQYAAKVMKAGNCGALPVIDQDKKVVGIITDRDICLTLSDKHTKAHAEIPISEIMGKKVHTINENDDISTAFKQMRKNRVGRLPVVDQDGRLKGILSVHNLVSQSFDGQEEHAAAHGENIIKTLKALSDRYSKNELAANAEKAIPMEL